MAAERLIEFKQVFADGAILQITVWQVPEPVPPSRHRLKYSLFYGYPGRRVVAFDSERGKGDHRHVGKTERAYGFKSMRELLNDFALEVRTVRGAL